jgi:hypothetical protein
MQRWHLCWHCTGILADIALAASVALAFLPALRWRQCQHCAVAVAGIAPALSPMTISSLQSFVFVVLVVVAKDVAR